jgi:transcriptional regulator with XRE-family HTH domain
VDYKYLGSVIRAERKKQRLTQEQLSERVDISSVFLSQIENGKKTPSLEKVHKIALALDLNINSLFFKKSETFDDIEIQISLLLKKRTAKEKQFILDILKYALSKFDEKGA